MLAMLVALTGCSAPKPAICTGTINFMKGRYTVDIFALRDGQYLAGYPFAGWVNKGQFVDISQCDTLRTQP